MAKILTQIEAQNIGNIRLYAGDAAELLAWAPAQSLARIDLIYPDPWPKCRTGSGASCRTQRLRRWRAFSRVGCGFRFVSDIDDYCAWTLAHLLRSLLIFFWTAERAADWQVRNGTVYTMTRYGPQSRTRGTGGGVFAVDGPRPEERALRARLEG